MSRSGKVTVELTPQQLSQMRRMIQSGEFGSASSLLREAVGSFLHRRALHGGAHVAGRFSRSLEARHEALPEVSERVELLFDAGDAKA